MKRVDRKIGEKGASAVGYLHERTTEMPHRERRPCVVVCPGGGYSFVSDRENEPVAAALFAAGYQVFVLTYSVGEDASGFQPLSELAALVAHVRQESDAYRVAPDCIAVMGFSAGGHLAASLGVLWNHEMVRAKVDTQNSRPDAMVLCYPVITAGPHAHHGSLENVSGGDASLMALFSLENQVTADAPPTFLWHTQEDAGVPVENALLLATALRAQGVPFEAHIFERGAHGLSLCNAEVGTPNAHNAIWLPLCLEWLGMRFSFER